MGIARVNYPGVFSITNPEQHAIRRKLLERGFDQRYLLEQWEDVVSEKVDLANARIKSGEDFNRCRCVEMVDLSGY